MSREKQTDDQLHLPDLFIAGFRGIKALSIPRLGRVTLLTGKNSVGKTTVLDAIRVYAARGHYSVLVELLESRGEVAIATDEDGDRVPGADFAALFHGREVGGHPGIVIGPTDSANQLGIKEATLTEKQMSQLERIKPSFFEEGSTHAFKIVFRKEEQFIPWFLPDPGSTISRRAYRYLRDPLEEGRLPSRVGCESLGPGLLNSNEVARYWDAIALTDEEDRAMQALQLILGEDLDRVAVIGDDDGARYRSRGRRVVVKLRSQPLPVPLKSLGDGALRLFGVALALTNSRDGFLLIDEAENGIHYSVQSSFWRLVLLAAQANNVQVIATTHSIDCVRGFTQAATDCEETEGALVRLERADEDMWEVEYSESELKIAAEQRIEVR